MGNIICVVYSAITWFLSTETVLLSQMYLQVLLLAGNLVHLVLAGQSACLAFHGCNGSKVLHAAMYTLLTALSALVVPSSAHIPSFKTVSFNCIFF